MPELGLSGSVRGARGNPRSYRDEIIIMLTLSRSNPPAARLN
jgi:hypothetical protein